MYNRYIPNGAAYTRIREEDAPAFHPVPPTPLEPPKASSPRQERTSPDPPPGLLGSLGNFQKPTWLTDLLASFKLEHLDAGDVLLLLILLFIFIEGDDLELVITLGLLLLFGLGGEKESEQA